LNVQRIRDSISDRPTLYKERNPLMARKQFRLNEKHLDYLRRLYSAIGNVEDMERDPELALEFLLQNLTQDMERSRSSYIYSTMDAHCTRGPFAVRRECYPHRPGDRIEPAKRKAKEAV